MEVTIAKRMFQYKDKIFVDPNPNLYLSQIKTFLICVEPEIASCKMNEGEFDLKYNCVIYTFQ